MNRQEFLALVKSPQKLDSESLSGLETLVNAYPFCQTIELLFAMNLFKENNFRYDKQLRVSAAYAPDRSKFRKHIKALDPIQGKYKPVKKPTGNFASVDVAGEDFEQLVGRLKLEIDKQSETTDLTRLARMHEIRDKLEMLLGDEKQGLFPEIKPDIKDYDFEHLQNKKPDLDSNLRKNADLIDRFIREEPSISTPGKSNFFQPDMLAKRSIEDKQEIVSETLANIYLKQGSYEKAIQVFKKLCLLYPEKNTFFAAQIEKIKKEQLKS